MEDAMMSTHCATFKSVLRDLASKLQMEDATKPDCGVIKVVHDIHRILHSFKLIGDSYRIELEAKGLAIIEFSKNIEAKESTITDLSRKLEAQSGKLEAQSGKLEAKEVTIAELTEKLELQSRKFEATDFTIAELSRKLDAHARNLEAKDSTIVELSRKLQEAEKYKAVPATAGKDRDVPPTAGKGDKDHVWGERLPPGDAESSGQTERGDELASILTRADRLRSQLLNDAIQFQNVGEQTPKYSSSHFLHSSQCSSSSRRMDREGAPSPPPAPTRHKRSADAIICLDSDSDEDPSIRTSPIVKCARSVDRARGM